MKRSVKQYLSDSLDQVKDPSYLQQLQADLLLHDAKCKYWKRGPNEAILQEFDTLEGFLSCFDGLFLKATSIRLRVKRHDIHVLYVLEAPDAVRLYDQYERLISQQQAGRGRYYYLPPGKYRIQIPAGKSQLFSYYFRGNTFRKKNHESYTFLHNILRALRQKSSQALVSRDFLVGPRTRKCIQTLCRGLKSKRLKNESFVFAKIHDLIDLSAEKIDEAETKMSYEKRIAIRAAKLLEQYIEDEGQEAEIHALAKDLKLEIDTINRYHKQYFSICLRDLRNSLLLTRAKRLLASGMSATETAYELNYNSRDAFARFFKKHCKQAPSEYIQSLNSNR